MTLEIIKQAAVTAKLLGYYIEHSLSTNLTTITKVNSPDGKQVVKFYPHWGQTEICQNTPILGHFLIRLHMEEHYGISTPHYWEGKEK